jgi:chloride channel protein, CIC family
VWNGRPEWARPAVGGIAPGLLLLAIRRCTGSATPYMYKTAAGGYVLWFLILLAFAKIAATSLSIGIGGSGGIFAPSLFIGVTSGMAYDDIVRHLFGAAAGQPALYAVVAMGAVFTSTARAPRPADLFGQRGGDDRRLLPHAAGDARRRDRVHRVPRAQLRDHLYH